MLRKNACIIRKLVIHDTDSIRTDPDIAAFLETARSTLGRNGRFVIRLSGIPQENSVLAEGNNKKNCTQCMEDFERLLVRKGYTECEHAWEPLHEEDYGEMDYRSDSGGVSRLIVTLYHCRICGSLKKEWQGDFCGDPQEYLQITEADRLLADQKETALQKSSGIKIRNQWEPL